MPDKPDTTEIPTEKFPPSDSFVLFASQDFDRRGLNAAERLIAGDLNAPPYIQELNAHLVGKRKQIDPLIEIDPLIAGELNTTERPTEKFPPSDSWDLFVASQDFDRRDLDAAERWLRENPLARQQLEKFGLIPKLSIEERVPKLGDKIEFKGESFHFHSNLQDHVVLYQKDRKMFHAIQPTYLSDKQLAEKYEKVEVVVGEKAEYRYLEKGNPEAGLHYLVKLGDKQFLSPDRQFVVAKRGDVINEEVISLIPLRQTENQGDRGRSKAMEGHEQRTDKAAKVDIVDHVRFGKVEERTRTIDGAEVKVRTPEKNPIFREVEIDGKKISLERLQDSDQCWYYSEGPRDLEGQQVKLHIAGLNQEDVVRLQKELLPILEQQRKEGNVRRYKTFDPNFIDPKWNDHPKNISPAPESKDQVSKAFTIYVLPEKVEQVGKAIDELLKERGLALPEDHKTGTVGDASRRVTESCRVSTERDHWELTSTREGRHGALLEAELSNRLYEFYKSYGTENGKLTEPALRLIEKDLGIKADQLHYDKDGRLMFISPDKSGLSNGMYYASDSSSRRIGSRTGRLALYGLYENQGLDPAVVHLKEQAAQRLEARRPRRQVPDADRLRTVRIDIREDGSLDRRERRAAEEVARKEVEKRETLNDKEIDALKNERDRLEKSKNESEREDGAKLRRTIEALEGKHGKEIQDRAHSEVMKGSTRLLERGESGGYGKTVTGGIIGIAILSVAALGWYQSIQKDREKAPLARPKVRR